MVKHLLRVGMGGLAKQYDRFLAEELFQPDIVPKRR